MFCCSSMDSTLKLVDFEKKKPKWVVNEHARGVYSFDYSRSYNFIVSCGLERSILLWNPFTGRSIGTLQGHTASVQDVIVNEQDSQLVSVSIDKVIKIWEYTGQKIGSLLSHTILRDNQWYVCIALF